MFSRSFTNVALHFAKTRLHKTLSLSIQEVISYWFYGSNKRPNTNSSASCQVHDWSRKILETDPSRPRPRPTASRPRPRPPKTVSSGLETVVKFRVM